jgi:hypothetical protein
MQKINERHKDPTNVGPKNATEKPLSKENGTYISNLGANLVPYL